MKKTAIIIGAGPAGLTAAYELLKQTDIHPVVLEGSEAIGGISQTVRYKGNRMDIGGHRFFSKDDSVMQWWRQMMPLQAPGGPDPASEDRVMLTRHRSSRIYFRRKFFDYPVSLSRKTLAGMGLRDTVRAGWGYLAAVCHKLPETSLENFYINRFGRPLYEMFFEDYTEKVWGVHPGRIGADWGAQRVKGLSVLGILKDVVTRPFRGKDIAQKKVETSLIEQFIYPKYGPGQLWETVADEVRARGGEIRLDSRVEGLLAEEGRISGVRLSGGETLPCDYLLSSMPVKDLVAGIEGVEVPADVRRIADGLPYRDFITVGVLATGLKIPVQDTWIYIQERDVKVGRLQIFNNWSPYMVADPEHTVFVGMEYFCNEGDELWSLPEEDFCRMAVDELARIDIVDRKDVLDTHRVRMRKAYPAYFGTYAEIGTVRAYLDGFRNLFCLGRNGQHRYNNMDHSMLTAMEAVRNIRDGIAAKDNVWGVNTEKSYHESK